MWGTTGIGFNAKTLKKHGIDTTDVSWSLIFDKELRGKAAKCGIGVVNERDEIFSAALNYLGHSINTEDKTKLKAAGALIKEAYLDFNYLHSSQYIDDLKNNKICVGIGYSGDILAQTQENPNIEYVIPNQGATVWVDVMAIPTNSPSPQLALKFIDFLMSPEVSAKNSNYAAYPTPMLDAQPLIDSEILSDLTIYPDAATLASLNMISPSNKKVRRIKHRLWVKAICIKGKWCSVPMRSIL
jgi:putrescine transport system substrate-binding protein